MLLDNDRNKLRATFFETWRKMQAKEPLQPLEQQLATIIAQHPEYHAILAEPIQYLEKDYSQGPAATNPFLHMALHQAIYEQITTNRPPGITAIYKTLCETVGNPHMVEHQMITILSNILWKMQHNEHVTEQAYLDELKNINPAAFD